MIRFSSSILTAAVMLLPTGLAAQVSRLRPSDETTVALELSKTFFEDSNFGWYTSVVRARLLTPLQPKTHLFIDWGLSVASLSGPNVPGTTSYTLSNPEIGLAFSDEAGASRGFVSVVLPIAQEFGDDDFATLTGIFSDIEHPERFVSELWSVNAGLTPSVPVGPSAALEFTVVGSLKVPTNGGDTELFARYGLGMSNETEVLRIYAELTGLGIVTQDGGSFGDRTIHQLSVGVEGLTGGPGFFLRVPLDDTLDNIDAIIGVSFTF